jgi:hypothetical protein
MVEMGEMKSWIGFSVSNVFGISSPRSPTSPQKETVRNGWGLRCAGDPDEFYPPVSAAEDCSAPRR